MANISEAQADYKGFRFFGEWLSQLPNEMLRPLMLRPSHPSIGGNVFVHNEDRGADSYIYDNLKNYIENYRAFDKAWNKIPSEPTRTIDLDKVLNEYEG